jgi:hypothetical protein
LTARALRVTVTAVHSEPARSTPSTASSAIASAVGPLARLAPEVGAAFARLQADVWTTTSPDRLALVDLRVAQLLRDGSAPGDCGSAASRLPETKRRAVSQWSTGPSFTGEERVCLGFAEQFVIDVAGVDDRLRTELGSALGPAGMLSFVVALFTLDYGRRVSLVLGALFPDGTGPGAGGPSGASAPEREPVEGMALLGVFDDLSRSVARLDSIDPVTTELVRLRGARQHNCRLCQSTRSVRALEAGADESLFDATERYEASDLSEPRKAALRLTDAIITEPGSVVGTLAEQLHRWYSPLQVVELVMDVMRNSGQKIAVALAADDPHVASGTEQFEITESGDVVYLA